MKVGMRKPSIKRSVKARTTGRIKRSAKRAVNPLYGKKGVGFAKNPSKSIKNSIYHRTTFSVSDVARAVGNQKKKNEKDSNKESKVDVPKIKKSFTRASPKRPFSLKEFLFFMWRLLWLLIGGFLMLFGLVIMATGDYTGIIPVIAGIPCFGYFFKKRNALKQMTNQLKGENQ